ncbi:DUF6489 family protein [Thioalkalivibrio sp. HK1]|uniref:DUF6489 family protein n=1 Tax=Thioalkalivibrio sp. HK1 TaxID=1469245 RepID=UPI00046E9426|nr:DUF6489 family protein [Thioalkalivibrio sp. HK1]
MKIHIEFDVTPAELREFFGLPNVQPLQEEMLQSFSRQMQSGIEGFDPVQMMRPFITPDPAGMEAMQKAFLKTLSTFAPGADSNQARQQRASSSADDRKRDDHEKT